MRPAAYLKNVALLGALTLACSPEPRPAPSESDSAPQSAQYGGVRAQLGPHGGELVVHETGEVHFYFDGAMRGGVTVRLPVGEEEPRAVALSYRDPVQGFVALEPLEVTRGRAQVLAVVDQHPHRQTLRLERLLPAPRHGGSVLAVGDDVVEVSVHLDATVQARLFESDAEDRAITVTVYDDEDQPHPVELAWDADAALYAGHAEGLEPVTGRLEVIVERDADVASGRGTLWALEIDEEAAADPGGPSLDVPALGAPPAEGEASLQLDLPELGSNLPTVIAVPPSEADGAETTAAP